MIVERLTIRLKVAIVSHPYLFLRSYTLPLVRRPWRTRESEDPTPQPEDGDQVHHRFRGTKRHTS